MNISIITGLIIVHYTNILYFRKKTAIPKCHKKACMCVCVCVWCVCEREREREREREKERAARELYKT